MGSKSDIIAAIALNFPRAENFYDLFGGGFSVTHYLLVNKPHWYKQFHYNEIKADVVDLVRRAIAGEFNYSVFKPAWVSREEFFAKKDTDAYIRLLWSFGNNQRTYLFGKEIEEYKIALHMAVVFDDFSQGAAEILKMSAWPLGAKTITQKRFVCKQRTKFLNPALRPVPLQQLERLEQLERLQQLERLEQLQQLTMTALSYEQVEIKPNSVVYCDIPYAGTAGYIANFDHKAFFDWAATREFPVLISEYEIKDNRFKIVYEIEKKTKLSRKGMTAHHDERLYWNGVK